MNIFIIAEVVLTLMLCIQGVKYTECQPNYLNYIGSQTVGKQGQLKRTFVNIQKIITKIGNVTYKPSEITQYTIYNAVPIFYYPDLFSRAEIVGNDTFIVKGDQVRVDISFDWTKTGLTKQNGTGVAYGIGEDNYMAIRIVLQPFIYSYELLECTDVIFRHGFQMKQIEPYSASDYQILQKMFNSIPGQQSIRSLLEEQINKIFQYYLRASLYDYPNPMDPQFDYVWAPGNNKPNKTIPFTRKARTFQVEKQGILTRFEVRAQNSPSWTCNDSTIPFFPTIPYLPLNPRIYGTPQQFISYDFYKNFIGHGINNNLLDTVLNQQNWGSDTFHFLAGNLYEVIPALKEKFQPNEPITGNCRATLDGLNVKQASFYTFNVSINFDCNLSVKSRQKIAVFAVGVQAQINGQPLARSIDFSIHSHTLSIAFFEYRQFKIANVPLAQQMVQQSFKRLYSSRLFGSGWPTQGRDYPQFITLQAYTVIYNHDQKSNTLSTETLNLNSQ